MSGFFPEARKFYYDCAQGPDAPAMASLKAVVPVSQILFGTYFSPEPIESTVNELPALKLPKRFEQMMLRGNAERLFRFTPSAIGSPQPSPAMPRGVRKRWPTRSALRYDATHTVE